MIDDSRVRSVHGAGLERMLDIAGELLLQIGYQRVILEDVARRAGVDRRAVYARFPSKEALFLTVLLRAQRLSVDSQVRLMRADPAELLPSRMSRTHYLSLVSDPVLGVLYSPEAGVLGKLSHEASATLAALADARREVIIEQLAVLREVGWVRRERTVETQYHVLMAIFSGWFVADGLPDLAFDHPLRADLLQETVAAALEVNRPPLDALGADHFRLADRHASLNELVEEEWRRRVG